MYAREPFGSFPDRESVPAESMRLPVVGISILHSRAGRLNLANWAVR